MFEKILIAVDGSPLSERAIASLEPLALRPTTELDLVRVVPGTPDAPAPDEYAEASRACDALERRLEAAGFRAEAHVLAGDDPAAAIVAFAAKEGASLVCLGTHGRTGLRRAALGSIAERVLRTADRPVLLFGEKAPAAPFELRRVLVPLDGSECAERVLPCVAEIAKHFGSEVILVHVEELAALDPALAVADERARTVRTFERARSALGPARVRTVVKTGAVAAGILEAVAETAPDAIVMTTHGRTGLARLAYGSVAEAVIRRSPVPIIATRPVASLGKSRGHAATVREGEF